MMTKKEKDLIANLTKVNEDLLKRIEALEKGSVKKEPKKTTKKAIAKSTKAKGGKSALAKKLEKISEEPKEEIVEEVVEETEQVEIPSFANRFSNDGDIPNQVYFKKLIKDGDSLKKVLCRGYLREYKGVEYCVGYKSFVNGKRDYAKGQNCWDIVVKDWGISVGRCSHLNEVEKELEKTATRIAQICSDKKQVKKYVEQFNKAPMLA